MAFGSGRRRAYDPALEKPEWAMGRRERENARRRREGLRPLAPRWPWVILVLAVAGGGAWWYYRAFVLPTLPVAERVAETPAPEEGIDSRMQVNPFEYRTLAPQTLEQVVRVTGTLQPAQQSQIAAQASGRIEEVRVRPGDAVAAGDTLVQIDVEQLRLQLDLQRSTQAATQSQLTLAEAQLDRVRALVERGVATTSDLDSAETSVTGLRAQMSALSDQVAAAELNLRQATVVAPFAGVIAGRSVDPGQFVSTGTPLLTLVDLSAVELVAQAPVAAGALVAVGQRVSVAVDGLPGRSFAGEVARINPIATQGARTIPVYVTIANPDGVLLGGMFAIGEVVVRQADAAIAVPVDAIREDRDGAHVLVVEDGVALRRPVAPGEVWRGNLVQIPEGLTAGDVVITAALPEIAPGDAVVLVE
ncbi:MAG: efflux RND transporter periplasmic adaptor subunit [Rubellimicrobium sp.]|nr:efflux RND transporter periplasmic adaptor subunit [Rubellimicrobium sp.]